MRQPVFRPLTAIVVLGVCVLPLLSVIAFPKTTEAEQRFTIDLAYQPNDQPGAPDELAITAPPNMELGVYLNDRLLDVVQTDNTGKFNLAMPVLPQRRNSLTALPTEIDSSTLPLLYDPYGFQEQKTLPANVKIEKPFLAAAFTADDGLHVYGSAAPESGIRIGAEGCINGVDIVADSEGSFHAVLLFDGNASLPKWYCMRVATAAAPEAASEFRVEAPTSRHARGEGIWNRSVHLKFSATDVRLVFTVEMPAGYLIYRNLAEGGISETQFIEYVFGDVTLNTFLDPRLTTWRQDREAASERVKIFIETRPLAFLVPEDFSTVFQLDPGALSDSIPPYAGTDTVTAELNGVRVIESEPSATQSKVEMQIWRGTFVSQSLLKIWVSRVPDSLADPIRRARLLSSISQIISGLNIRPSALLRDSLEGQIVGLLPARVPAAVQAQVYDAYRAAYLADPVLGAQSAKPTFQTYLRDLPSRLPEWASALLFGALWLIPSLLMQRALLREQPFNMMLAYITAGVTAAILLTLNWLPILSRYGIDRSDYVLWITAAFLALDIFYFPLPAWTGWLSRRPWALIVLSILAAPLITLAARAVLNILPDGWSSALLTGLSLFGFFSLTWLASQTGKENAKFPSAGLILVALAAIYGLSLPLQSLPLSAQLTGTLGVSTFGITLIRPMLPIVLLLALLMNLRNNYDRPLGGEFSMATRGFARVLFVAFAVGLMPAWGFIPLSIVIGLVMFDWLVPITLLSPASVVQKFAEGHHGEGVKQTLLLNRQTRLYRAVESNLQKKVRQGDLKDENYGEQREKLELSARELERPKYLKSKDSQLTLRDLAFNFGAGPLLSDNLRNALAWGILLVTPILLVEIWSFAATGITSSLLFPFLGNGVRLLGLAAQYLGGVALLGYFFPYMRGRNGLEKSGWLAFMVVAAFLPYHMLFATSLSDWIAVIIWAGTVLTYYLLVGFLAFDLRTLSRFNVSWTRLPDLYDFGALAFYLTGSGAPLVTVIFTALFGNIQELIPSLLKVMFPSFTFAGAQFELLQMLLDLASRIATGVLK